MVWLQVSLHPLPALSQGLTLPPRTQVSKVPVRVGLYQGPMYHLCWPAQVDLKPTHPGLPCGHLLAHLNKWFCSSGHSLLDPQLVAAHPSPPGPKDRFDGPEQVTMVVVVGGGVLSQDPSPPFLSLLLLQVGPFHKYFKHGVTILLWRGDWMGWGGCLAGVLETEGMWCEL
jgi:hypothetical protein